MIDLMMVFGLLSPQFGSNMVQTQVQIYDFNFEYPRESIEGVKNTHFEDIILLATLAVTKFPKCNASKSV